MSKYLERTNASKPTFGDYVTLEMKCYGVPNEHFIHEVLSSPFNSNSWREVPLKAGDFEEQLHDTLETVIAVRTQGLNSRDGHIFAVRLADVLPMIGTNWSWRESPLRSRIAELEGKIDQLIEAGDWGAKLAINIGALSGDNQYKLAKKRNDKWDALVKDWEESER